MSKMRIEKEKEIEAAACKAAKKLGMLEIKLNGIGARGKPDRVFLFNGETLFIEFKSPGRKPTRSQMVYHNRLRKVGHKVLVVDSIAEAKAAISAFALIATEGI